MAQATRHVTPWVFLLSPAAEPSGHWAENFWPALISWLQHAAVPPFLIPSGATPPSIRNRVWSHHPIAIPFPSCGTFPPNPHPTLESQRALQPQAFKLGVISHTISYTPKNSFTICLYASLDTPCEVKTTFMVLFENSKSSKEILYSSKLFFIDCKPFAS